MEKLEDILNEPVTEEAQAEATQEAVTVDETTGKADPPSDRLRDEHERFAKKDETGVETPQETAEPVPPTEQPSGLPKEEYSALRAIREENKQLKASIEALSRQMQAPQQPQQPTDFWDDPNAFLEGRFRQFGQELFQSFEQKQQAQRLDQSEAAAKAKYADYDEAFQAFEQAVQLNPRLAQELAQAPDPGEFAYSRGKTALTIQKVGSIDQLLATERAKWEAEMKAAVPSFKLPSTTAADGSVGARSGPAWSGPPALGEIVKTIG